MSVHVAYTIGDYVPGAAMQSVGNADRPLSAFTAAVASWCRGNELMGAWKGATDAEIERDIQDQFAASNVPEARAKLWVRALNGRLVGDILHGTGRGLPLHTSYASLSLSEYQVDAINQCTVAGGVLALAVGLGKTVTAVNAACFVADMGVASQSRCWILCPLNAMGAWKPYVAALQKLFVDVQIVSVDSAHKLEGVANAGGVLIIDESHTLGAMTARRTKAAHYLRPLFDSCFCLTGTLLHAGVEKCLSILDLAVPGAAVFSSRWKCGEHFNCMVKKKIGHRTVVELEKPSAKKTEFLEYLSRYCVSLDKDSPDVKDVACIPAQELHIAKVGEPWMALDKQTAQIVDNILEGGGELPHAAEVMHLLAREGLEAKIATFEALRSDMASTGGASRDTGWVLFAHYRESLDRLERALKDGGSTYVRVDGDTKIKDRLDAERKFQSGEVKFFLGQTTAAGIAINLFRTHLSATFDHSFKAIDYAQSLGRTCRRGQTKECLHFDFVSNRLQRAIVERLRTAADFDASCVDYQDAKRVLAAKGIK